MDPSELLRAAPEVQKIVATIVAGVPIAEIVKAVLVPPAAVLGKRMADRVERCFEKTGEMVQAAGSPVQEVPEKILLPILQGVALEDDENLHEMWASLLANAASPATALNNIPGFIAILREMSPDQAALLKWLSEPTRHEQAFADAELIDAYAKIRPGDESGPYPKELGTCIEGLEAWQLVRRAEVRPDLKTQSYEIGVGGNRNSLYSNPPPVVHIPVHETFRLTHRGRAFIDACSPPRPKKNC
jgi:Abortive infection alpha